MSFKIFREYRSGIVSTRGLMGKKNGNNIIEGSLQIMGPSGLMAFAAVLIAIHPVLDDNDDANNVNGGVNKKNVTWKPVVA